MAELGVLIPTRSRPHNVSPILRAWAETGAFGVADPIFVVDADDAKLPQYISALSGPGTKWTIAPSWQPLVPKLNTAAMAHQPFYPFLAFMGDDHIPRTPMWAHKLIEEHVVNRAAIVYGKDGLQDARLCTWWSMDSRLVLKLGRMVPAPVQHMYCDNSVMALGGAIASINYRPDVLIEHMHPFAGKAPTDDQYERVNRREQYARDEAQFHAWIECGLARDATLLAGIWG